MIVKTLFDDIGLDPKKGAEVSHFYQAKNSKHMYVADYRIFGKILKKPSVSVVDIYYKNDEDYFKLGFEEGHTSDGAIIFYIDAFLPWVLEEDPEIM
ncbi:hypothetical protein [Aquibacillus koreensis]|nr:hypothetical protein [Aquibacillus koreensis]